MRYPAAEKAEIIKLVEQSHLSARQTLDRIDKRRSICIASVNVRSYRI